MNRERLTILRDHLASLPPEQFDMADYINEKPCGTVACIAGWTNRLWKARDETSGDEAALTLGLTDKQKAELFFPAGFGDSIQDRDDALHALDTMLESDDDDALPDWPEKFEAAS